MAQYGLNNVQSYDNLKGPMVKSHEGSQSHDGTSGPGNTCDPGGYTAGHVGEGTPTRLESGAPHGMDM